MKKAKSVNQQVCEYIESNPLCSTKDLAEAFDISSNYMAKKLHQLEGTDYVRAVKASSRRNLWIRGTNQSFRPGAGNPFAKNNGGVHYPTTGFINRKRLVTITVSANDALALLSKGFNRLQVS